MRAAVLAAVGFEILKVVGTYYIATTTKNPAVATFGPIIGVLLFLNLVFRFLLYCTAWTATGTPDDPLAGSVAVAGGAVPTGSADATESAGSGSTVGGAARAENGRPTRSRGLAVALTIGALARRRGRRFNSFGTRSRFKIVVPKPRWGSAVAALTALTAAVPATDCGQSASDHQHGPPAGRNAESGRVTSGSRRPALVLACADSSCPVQPAEAADEPDVGRTSAPRRPPAGTPPPRPRRLLPRSMPSRRDDRPAGSWPAVCRPSRATRRPAGTDPAAGGRCAGTPRRSAARPERRRRRRCVAQRRCNRSWPGSRPARCPGSWPTH